MDKIEKLAIIKESPQRYLLPENSRYKCNDRSVFAARNVERRKKFKKHCCKTNFSSASHTP